MTTTNRDFFYIYDLPVEYKGIKLYPVKMRDYYYFSGFSSCLLFEKNSEKNPEISAKLISMSYLEYLFFLREKEQSLDLLAGLLRLVTNRKKDDTFQVKFFIDDKNKPKFELDNQIYDSSDFDEIKKIIADQNSVDLPDETIQKEVREKMEEARRFISKKSNTKIANLEEQMVALALFTGWPMDQIYNLSIRRFFMALKRANHMIMSDIYLTASMSGFVTFKDKSVVKGWLNELDVDKYSDVIIDRDEINNKINGSNSN